jgi:tRNA pseudouridine32 synthase/23S rRNA pseudouridine746 synthase
MPDPIYPTYINYFPTKPAADEIPAIMPSPFAHMPHPLAKRACDILQRRLTTETHWPQDFFSPNGGKMFGVLVVRDKNDQIGFLCAFSGMMNGQWLLPGFAPPLFNLAEQNRYLPAGRDELALLAEQLLVLENADKRAELQQKIAQMQQQRDQALAELKQQHKAAKVIRKQQRLALQSVTDEVERQTQMEALALASQHHKRAARNASQHWLEKLQHLQQQLDLFEQQIAAIKEARTEKSRMLHKRVFAAYLLTNHLNEQQAMPHFFDESKPPAGAGDCAGPKLIHYAHQHHLQPIALAEFWWGTSPAAGVRHHGHFYPACRGKCRPILPFMLRGLELEPEPCYGENIDADEPQIIYQDDLIFVINKPAGLMSEPGKVVRDSVFYRLLQRFPEYPELRLAHRLDMSTSGLLLVAKDLQTYRFLQQQFIRRSVDKRYEALLAKKLPLQQGEGNIELPLRVDFDDRPRQLVCYEHGKPAKTHWQLIAHEGETTRVYFYPLTGRTHQLRIHASHRDGLDAAIVGDDLYGQAEDRLMLHAQRLGFTHPTSRKWLEFELPAPF